jgi:hypothetical protein
VVEDVQRRLDYPMDDQERTAVESALEDMSDEARFCASREWSNPETAPYMVRKTVIKAVVRWARNMQGLIRSRAGDEEVLWPNVGESAGAPEFTKAEKKLLKALGSGIGYDFFGSVEVVAYGAFRCIDDGYRPVDGGGNDPFPMYDPLHGAW